MEYDSLSHKAFPVQYFNQAPMEIQIADNEFFTKNSLLVLTLGSKPDDNTFIMNQINR